MDMVVFAVDLARLDAEAVAHLDHDLFAAARRVVGSSVNALRR
ncbi:hypothetical protein [Streptosporangium canum]